jgi:hypothetical protein
MVVISTSNFPPRELRASCAMTDVIAPNLSEYVSERHVRHSLSCESSGYQFETSEYLRFERAQLVQEMWPSPQKTN